MVMPKKPIEQKKKSINICIGPDLYKRLTGVARHNWNVLGKRWSKSRFIEEATREKLDRLQLAMHDRLDRMELEKEKGEEGETQHQEDAAESRNA